MYEAKFEPNTLTLNEVEWFTRAHNRAVKTGIEATSDVLRLTYKDGTSEGLVIFKGPYTKYGMCRDCGDHYIIARYSRFDRIDKDTLKITIDVEDR